MISSGDYDRRINKVRRL